MEKRFKPEPMVNWFHPFVLAQSGLKSVVSKMFGNYADRRETQAALKDEEAEAESLKQHASYKALPEIWVDFISDTGDGFNSTYSVAIIAAQNSLNVNANRQFIELPRAKILILGGDQIYPTPTGEVYDKKFRIPFEAALPGVKNDPDGPHMYAIPGNHDWYDGLGNFMKIFCQQRRIGNWSTYQLRSYFAIPLPNNYWLWATDIQLNEDIDKPQLDYFRMIAKERMQQGDKVILCTAEPAWVYKELHSEDKSYERLTFFIETYITKDKYNLVNKTFKLATVLTGDLHHYAHYCSEDEKGNFDNHYIGVGGGGAFTHLTHNLPKKLDKLEEKNVKLKAAFPDEKDSRNLLWGNLLFPFKNLYFSFLLGLLYFLFYWLLESHFVIVNTTFVKNATYVGTAIDLNYSEFLNFTGYEILRSPGIFLLSALIVVGFTIFTDTKTGRKGIFLWGLFHGLLQSFCLISVIYQIIQWNAYPLTNGYVTEYFLFILQLIVAGTLCGGLLMGLYLLISNLVFRIHLDESSSSLICEDYKSFLRMHISNNALTIYPIGIKKVTKDWKVTYDPIKKKYSFGGRLPEYHLIEEPIVIKLN